jgi:hypothetical protein
MYKTSTLYTIPCHNTGHVNVMLVLQSCTDSLQVPPGETYPTSSDGACDVSNTAVQQDIVVVEECFIAVHEEADVVIKQEEIPEDIYFPYIKAEPDEVSYVCVCYETHFTIVQKCLFFVTSVFLDNSNSCTVGNENVYCDFFGVWGVVGGVGGSVLDGLVCV